ncbi:N-acetyltransferase [Actinorhabdospora filicis]|uniref:N-acetyltransferase n=1 Tax=Actinorhabdospora filicis TaxID=1785913 RepID=A0A9W6SLW9_9ACTN|nr:GNAT family N-acetyltransferase [Actinorhabdospora filicis]GLZ76991.1 N-acetyltransferase [Actinorhabdospora filicis]
MSDLTIVPASSAPWADLAGLLGFGKEGDRCYCRRFAMPSRTFWYATDAERAASLEEDARCGEPGAPTAGLIGYRDGEPIAWVAVAPRTRYPGLLGRRVTWAKRDEDKTDPGVWSVTCFFVRKDHRREGLTTVLAKAAADYAREQGATAVEGYAMITVPGKVITWGELHVGPLGAFLDAGYTQVAQPTLRRVVMRMDFGEG